MTYLLSVFNGREHADQLRSEVLEKRGLLQSSDSTEVTNMVLAPASVCEEGLLVSILKRLALTSASVPAGRSIFSTFRAVSGLFCSSLER